MSLGSQELFTQSRSTCLKVPEMQVSEFYELPWIILQEACCRVNQEMHGAWDFGLCGRLQATNTGTEGARRGFQSNPCCWSNMPHRGLGAGSKEVLICWYVDGITPVDEGFSCCIKGSCQGAASFALMIGVFALCRRSSCECSFSCAVTPKQNGAANRGGSVLIDCKKT